LACNDLEASRVVDAVPEHIEVRSATTCTGKDYDR
jgi:hypothetical protein